MLHSKITLAPIDITAIPGRGLGMFKSPSCLSCLQHIQKYGSAFLNSGGGTLCVGVADDGKIDRPIGWGSSLMCSSYTMRWKQCIN